MSSNIVNYVKPIGGRDRKDINRILETITDFVARPPEAEGARERITVTPHTRVKTSSANFPNINFLESELRDIENFEYRRLTSNSPDTYPLTQSLFGTPTFPVKNTKFGGSMEQGGTGQYIQVADDAILNITDKITLALWLNLPATQSGDISRNIISKVGQYYVRIDPHSEVTNRLAFFPYNPTAEPRVSFIYTPNIWFHLVVTYDSGVGAKMFINKTLESSQTDTGSLATTSNVLRLGNIAAGAGFGHRMAHLCMIHNACSQSWIDDNFDGILDTTGANIEIGYWPLIGDERPEPEASAGLCST